MGTLIHIPTVSTSPYLVKNYLVYLTTYMDLCFPETYILKLHLCFQLKLSGALPLTSLYRSASFTMYEYSRARNKVPGSSFCCWVGTVVSIYPLTRCFSAWLCGHRSVWRWACHGLLWIPHCCCLEVLEPCDYKGTWLKVSTEFLILATRKWLQDSILHFSTGVGGIEVVGKLS